MAILILLILVSTIYSRCKNKKIAIIFSLAIMYLARYVFVARAQEISFLLFIIEFLLIEKLLETGRKRYVISLLVIPILLANLHSSVYPMYFVLYLPYVVEYVLLKVKLKLTKIKIEKREHINILFVTLGLSMFSGLFTTTGLAPYTDMINVIRGMSGSFIGELQNSTWSNNKALFIINITTTIIVIFGKQKIKITDIFYILGFTIMSLLAYRCFYFFLFIASIPIARILSDFIKENEINIENRCVKTIFYISLIILYILLIIVSCLRAQGEEYVNKSMYPIEASEYILKNLNVEEIRIYNGFNYGSYLEFRGIKAFIDSRSGMFTEEFNGGCTILKDWRAIDQGNVDYSEIFEKYDITHALAANYEKLSKELSEDEQWNLIYEDEYFKLFEKK